MLLIHFWFMNPNCLMNWSSPLTVAQHLKNPEDLHESRPSPRTKSLIASAVQWAERIVRRIDGLSLKVICGSDQTWGIFPLPCIRGINVALFLLRKLAVEMALDIFTAKRVSCVGQDDRIDDLISCKLSGDKCAVGRQFLADEFHFSGVFKCFDPLFVWHFRISSAEIRVCREYTLFGPRNCGWVIEAPLLGIWHSNGAPEPPRRTSLAASLCPNEEFLNRLTETEGRKFWTPAVLFVVEASRAERC